MKRHISRIFVTIVFVLFFAFSSMAGGPPLPPGHGDSTDDGDPTFQSPIGAGLLILIGLGLAYGGKRVYDARRRFKK